MKSSKFFVSILCFCGLFFFSHLEASTEKKPAHVIGIIIPLTAESHYLEKQIKNPQKLTLHGIHYQLGTIQGKSVVFALSGMGMINAAMVTTRLIADFHPDLILMSGSAGSVNPALHRGDVVVGKNVINVDFGKLTAQGIKMISHHLKSPQNNKILPLIFSPNLTLLDRAKNLKNPRSFVISVCSAPKS
jgi:adenosylhomocysteine nucleosidase